MANLAGMLIVAALIGLAVGVILRTRRGDQDAAGALEVLRFGDNRSVSRHLDWGMGIGSVQDLGRLP